MTDRPILFSAPMIRALIDGRKSQTRRLAWQPWKSLSDERGGKVGLGDETRPNPFPVEFRKRAVWQKAQPGDRLWVRETFARRADGLIAYRAGPHPWDVKHDICRWRPSIHMFRWMSRLTLVVTGVSTERLLAIREYDAKAEGATFRFEYHDMHERSKVWCMDWDDRRLTRPPVSAKAAFSQYWQLMHGSGSWQANPIVVALTFTVHQLNIDAMGGAA